jgi:methyltransferase (TIGR00027 family)
VRADRPSSTARLIARCTLLAARTPALQPLVPAGAARLVERFLRASGGTGWFDFALRHRWANALLFAGERAVLPGIIAQYLARKRWIEKRVVAALDDGCEQLVVLGAGFDTLAWRLASAHPRLQCFEIDHPATQRVKAAALAPENNLALLPADLVQVPPSAVLSADPRFNPQRRTCYVAEGLLMYFPEAHVRAILLDLARRPATEVVFTFMAPGADGRATFRGGSAAIGAWLRLRREPFAWALAPEQLEDFLRPLHLRVHACAGAPELRTEILAPAGLATAPLAAGEHLCLASSAHKVTQ